MNDLTWLTVLLALYAATRGLVTVCAARQRKGA